MSDLLDTLPTEELARLSETVCGFPLNRSWSDITDRDVIDIDWDEAMERGFFKRYIYTRADECTPSMWHPPLHRKAIFKDGTVFDVHNSEYIGDEPYLTAARHIFMEVIRDKISRKLILARVRFYHRRISNLNLAKGFCGIPTT